LLSLTAKVLKNGEGRGNNNVLNALFEKKIFYLNGPGYS